MDNEKFRRMGERQGQAEEEKVRWYKHLKDIAEGKEDTQGKILELEKEITELKEKLKKYENTL